MSVQIGDQVVCINNANINPSLKPPPLKLGGIYIVYDIQDCIKCGCVSYDVGLTCAYLFTYCIICQQQSKKLSTAHYAAARRFVKIDTSEDVVEELETKSAVILK